MGNLHWYQLSFFIAGFFPLACTKTVFESRVFKLEMALKMLLRFKKDPRKIHSETISYMIIMKRGNYETSSVSLLYFIRVANCSSLASTLLVKVTPAVPWPWADPMGCCAFQPGALEDLMLPSKEAAAISVTCELIPFPVSSCVCYQTANIPREYVQRKIELRAIHLKALAKGGEGLSP